MRLCTLHPSRDTFAPMFAECGFDAEMVLSEFCPAVSDELKERCGKVGREEEEGDILRRPSRKRESATRFEDEELPASNRRRKSKNTSGQVEERSSEAPSAASSFTEASLKGKKRRRGEREDTPTPTQEEKASVSLEPQVSVAFMEYEPTVAPLVSSGDIDYLSDTTLAPFLFTADLWLRNLEALQRRLMEISIWSVELNALEEAAQSSSYLTEESRIAFDSTLARLLSWAQKRQLSCGRRLKLEALIRQLDEWTLKAAGVDSRSHLLGFDVLKEFIKQGEAFNIYLPLLEPLRGHLKQAKAWIGRFLKMTGDKKGATDSELEGLVTEAEGICVDLSEFTSQITLDSKKYCICRQAYHSEMIGCDDCDEWYHLQCIGMSQLQADRTDKYLCIRCTLRVSFLNAATLAAQTVNRWMSPIDIIRTREQRLTKVLLLFKSMCRLIL